MHAAACSSACARSTLVRSLMIMLKSCVSLRLSLRTGSSFIDQLLAQICSALVEVRLAKAAHQLGHLDPVQLRQQLQLVVVVIIERGVDLASHSGGPASDASAARR